MRGETRTTGRSVRGVLLASASGALYALCFPPAALFPLAFVALVPLLLALRRAGPWAGAGLGLCFSLTAGAALAPWLPGTLADFFGLSSGASALYAAGALLLCGLPYAGFGAWVAACRGRRLPLVTALALGASELFRLYGPLPTPWALLAYSQAPWLQLAQSADLVGAAGLGMLIAAQSGALAAVLGADTRARRLSWSHALAPALLAAAWLYGGLRLEQRFGHGEEISVALVQGAVAPERRFRPEHRAENLERHLALTRPLAAAPPQLVLWPELSVEFQAEAEPALWRELADAARGLGAELLVGAPFSRLDALVAQPTNSALLLRDGRVADRHDKFALMPFSETRPALLPLGRELWRPGRSLRPLRTRAGALGVLLCSEALHPELAQRLVAQGAELLANPSNDDWFSSEAAARHQVAASVFRAIETRRPVIRPSTRGPSSVVDAHGRVLALAPYGEAALLEARVRRGRERSPYQVTSQRLPGAASGLALVSIFWVAGIRRRDP